MNASPVQQPIGSVKTDQAVVALTFDDGPHPTQTWRLLELFAAENIKVTFFEIGKNVAAHPELARAILAAGHEIGNHSRTHANLGKMTDVAAVGADLRETQAIIKEATGYTPVVFRAPYISHGAALWAALDELGLPSIGGAHSASDWDAAVTKEGVIERSVKAGAGDIVILHTWPEKTAEALPEIIKQLRAKGLRFVTVSELLALRHSPTP
jgi:peptidoglycan-N-acetylglucosamine deacetylase